MDHEALIALVMKRIYATDSPEQIVGRLKLLFPNNPPMRISHEPIYKILRKRMEKLHGKEKAQLQFYLRHGNSKRTKRSAPYNTR